MVSSIGFDESRDGLADTWRETKAHDEPLLDDASAAPRALRRAQVARPRRVVPAPHGGLRRARDRAHSDLHREGSGAAAHEPRHARAGDAREDLVLAAVARV